MRYQSHILRMQNLEGFYEQYCKFLSDYSRNEDAYDAAERLYYSHYQQNRFKNFESFKASLSRWNKKRNASKQS